MDIVWQSESELPLTRLTAEGQWQSSWGDDEWAAWTGANMNAAERAVRDELARRLLEERKQMDELDEHCDKMEAEAPVPPSRLYPDPIERRLVFLERRDSAQIEENNDLKRRIAELDQNLAQQTGKLSLVARRVLKLEGQAAAPEAPPAVPLADPPPPLYWDRTQGIMVDDEDKLVLDLSDYFEGGNMSGRDHDLLENLAALWSAWGPEGYLRKRLMEAQCSGAALGWYRQLRSELLAKPWKEGV